MSFTTNVVLADIINKSLAKIPVFIAALTFLPRVVPNKQNVSLLSVSVSCLTVQLLDTPLFCSNTTIYQTE